MSKQSAVIQTRSSACEDEQSGGMSFGSLKEEVGGSRGVGLDLRLSDGVGCEAPSGCGLLRVAETLDIYRRREASMV